MEAFLQQFQHLRIQLEEITSATDNFNDDNCIGVGGFGKVYKGELSHSKGRSTVAIKRLDPKHGQGIPEFLKEITTLSRYSHENLVSLLGFCYQNDEMILVYEYASRGSLDRYLNSPHLTWLQRLKICLDAAKGLSYLHDPGETHHRLIHCDVKSANILLDEQWNGKVSDFGLSTMGPANELHSVIIILAAGTHGYIDPLYQMTNTLTKESDVYSFGVVLFEVLCGKLCCTYSNGRVQQNLVRTCIESYEENKLNDFIFKDPTIQPLEQRVLEIFSDIAYRCLKESREDRPKIAEVVTQLESALENHQFDENQKLVEQLVFYEEMTTTAETPLYYISEVELRNLLYKGVLINGGKTYFSLNKKGEHCEMISIAGCLSSDDVESYRFCSANNSRFAMGTYILDNLAEKNIITNVRTQFLSPGITYTVNLVFKLPFKMRTRCKPILLGYKLQGERESSISYVAYLREDGWWICELYQFTCDHRTVHLQILFEEFRNYNYINVEGIEFQPLENLEHIDEKQQISDSDSYSYSYSYANWEEKLPSDFEDIMKRSENSLQWTTKEEAYSIICKGFLIIDDKTSWHIWFSVDKNGKKCHMLPAKAALRSIYDRNMISLPESRFGEAVQCDYDTIYIKTIVRYQLVSSETAYACYLVYKIPKDQSGFKAPVEVNGEWNSGYKTWYIYLLSAQTPVIKPKDDQNTHNPLNRLNFKGLPRQRSDGWMEVQIWEWGTTTAVYMDLRLGLCDKKKFDGLIIEGIEYRPI